MIEVADFSKEQQTSYCIDLDTRNRQVVEGCARIKDRLQTVPDHDGRIAIVCYGPSLEETWQEVRHYDKIITCSGAHKFLIDRGIVPTWHAEVDPRPHKADLISIPHKDVQYLVASVCHKAVFDLLEGFNVKLWHVFSHESDRKVPMAFPRGEWCITGGSNVGLRCMVLARFMGFRRMTLFGMDYSFKIDGTQHAGWHPKEIPYVHAVQVGEEFYYTNPAMHKYAQEFFNEITQLGDIELEVVGKGLLQAQIRERMNAGTLRTKSDKPPAIAAVLPQVISPEYMELNKRLHAENPDYGVSGSKRADVVRKLVASTKPASVLDYGCGKGTLGMSLPFPIWEYDPAIPGKDAPPRPAELVICTDVLEHIEPEYLEAVLLDLSRVTQKVCYCVINTGPARKTYADGRNTHLIQQPLEWWQATLARYFSVAKAEANGPEVMFILGPRKPEAPKAPPTGAPPLDFSNRTTPVRYKGTEVRFHTPNQTTEWRARSLITKEPSTIEWIDSMQAGDVLYDVGANVGGYTVLAAKRGVKVFAFEPESENYALLCRNISLNALDANAICVAVCEREKLDTLHLSARGGGGSGHMFGDCSRNGNHPTQMAIGLSIDVMVEKWKLPQPTHIKIDVDGNEHRVIQGAFETLKNVQSVLVEINPNHEGHADIIRELEAAGFTFDPAQVERATRKEGAFKGVAEYVFRRPNQVEHHFKAVIDSANLYIVPFEHIYLENALPQDVYESLLASLDAREWEQISKARPVQGYPERFVSKCEIKLSGLHKALCEKFGISGDFTDETLLVRDMPGYAIGPHTDSPKKVITALFYLRGQEGTSIYTPKEAGFTCKGGPHYEFEQFEKVATMPFKPNSMFAFVKSDKSFHGVETTQHQRDVLLFDIRRK